MVLISWVDFGLPFLQTTWMQRQDYAKEKNIG
jgi:hypothetical protein